MLWTPILTDQTRKAETKKLKNLKHSASPPPKKKQ